MKVEGEEGRGRIGRVFGNKYLYLGTYSEFTLLIPMFLTKNTTQTTLVISLYVHV